MKNTSLTAARRELRRWCERCFPPRHRMTPYATAETFPLPFFSVCLVAGVGLALNPDQVAALYSGTGS